MESPSLEQIFELQLKIKIKRKDPSLNELKLYKSRNYSHFLQNEVRNNLECIVKIIKLPYSKFSYQLKPLLFYQGTLDDFHKISPGGFSLLNLCH